MSDQDHDWLDDRLTVGDYISDDGFTARVTAELPKFQATRKISPRIGILLLCAAFCMMLAAILVIPLIHAIGQSSAIDVRVPAGRELTSLVQQPMIFYGAAGAVVLATLASIPLLRRWV